MSEVWVAVWLVGALAALASHRRWVVGCGVVGVCGLLVWLLIGGR